MSGRACLRDSHVTASTVVALMATGRSSQEIIRMFPALTAEDLQEALAYAAWWIDEESSPRTVPEIVRQPCSVSEPLPVAEPEMQGAPEALESVPGITPEKEEILELFHPYHPDRAVVVLTCHGLLDRRWGIQTIAWSDIRELRRKSGRKTIQIVLRNPEFYISSMPFLQRLRAQIKLVFNIQTLHLDTASLGIRTKDLFLAASRLWVLHRGKPQIHRKRRRSNRSVRSSEKEEWNNYPST